MFDFDQRDIDLTSSDSSQPDSLLSPHRSISTGLGSEHGDPTVGEVVIPPSASSSIGDRDAFSLGGSVHAGSGRGSRFGSSIFRREEDDKLFDPGFAFDDMGNMVDSVPDGVGEAAALPEHPSLRDPAILSDDHRTDQGMQDANEDIVSSREIRIYYSADSLQVYQHDDDALLPGQDNLDAYANAEAFTARPHQSVQPASSPLRQSSASVQPNEPTEPQSDHADEESVTAPAVRRRKRKGIAPDVQQELGNRDLSGWSNNYLNQMQEVLRGKIQTRSTALAKKNADFWVLQNGVGGLGVTYGQEDIPEPLRMFTGNALLEALTGLRLTAAGEKHARDEGDDEVEDEADKNQRRVRTRSDEDAIGRADVDVVMEDTMYMGDDAGNMADDSVEAPRDEVSRLLFTSKDFTDRHQTIEVGREAQTPVAEHPSSVMPWNNTASIRGSSARPPSGHPFSAGFHATSSVDGGLAVGLGGMSSRKGSRMVSASPLGAHGDLRTNLEALRGDDDDAAAGAHDPGLDNPHYSQPNEHGVSQTHPADTDAAPAEQFEVFGPAALVQTQQANHPAWIRQALDEQSVNFLAFVQESIREADEARENNADVDASGATSSVEHQQQQQQQQQQQDPNLVKGSVLFETLLSPVANNRIVAAQGLLHVLTLATKNLLSAGQDVAFGSIELRVADALVGPVRATVEAV